LTLETRCAAAAGRRVEVVDIRITNGEERRSNAEGVHSIRVGSYFAKGGENGVRQVAGGRHLRAQLIIFAPVRQLSVPEEIGDFLEVNAARQLADIVTAEGELSSLAIDFRDAGLRGNNAFQPARNCGRGR
jgi:hypothetical protein